MHCPLSVNVFYIEASYNRGWGGGGGRGERKKKLSLLC